MKITIYGWSTRPCKSEQAICYRSLPLALALAIHPRRPAPFAAGALGAWVSNSGSRRQRVVPGVGWR
jgi:hypothetical protein